MNWIFIAIQTRFLGISHVKGIKNVLKLNNFSWNVFYYLQLDQYKRIYLAWPILNSDKYAPVSTAPYCCPKVQSIEYWSLSAQLHSLSNSWTKIKRLQYFSFTILHYLCRLNRATSRVSNNGLVKCLQSQRSMQWCSRLQDLLFRFDCYNSCPNY